MINHSDSETPRRPGRPKGASNLRSRALADRLAGKGKDPAEALVRIAEEADARGDFSLAADAWKALLPYVHARLKPVESDPDSVIALARRLKEAAQPQDTSFGERLREACAKLGLGS